MISLLDIARQERLQGLRELVEALPEAGAHRFAAWCLLAAMSALTQDMEMTLERLVNELLLAEDRFHTRPTQNAGYELSLCDNRELRLTCLPLV